MNWIEVWTKGYWRHYGGLAIGTIGWLVQRACVRIPHDAYCISQMHADRLVAEGYRGTPVVLPGLYAGTAEPKPPTEVDATLVVYAGRHVREKRVDLLVRAFAVARVELPELRLELYGDGPEHGRIARVVEGARVGDAVLLAGKRPEAEVDAAIARAACVATASEREGYGLVIVEAAAHGTPSVIVAGPENASVELRRGRRQRGRGPQRLAGEPRGRTRGSGASGTVAPRVDKPVVRGERIEVADRGVARSGRGGVPEGRASADRSAR